MFQAHFSDKIPKSVSKVFPNLCFLFLITINPTKSPTAKRGFPHRSRWLLWKISTSGLETKFTAGELARKRVRVQGGHDELPTQTMHHFWGKSTPKLPQICICLILPDMGKLMSPGLTNGFLVWSSSSRMPVDGKINKNLRNHDVTTNPRWVIQWPSTFQTFGVWRLMFFLKWSTKTNIV